MGIISIEKLMESRRGPSPFIPALRSREDWNDKMTGMDFLRVHQYYAFINGYIVLFDDVTKEAEQCLL